MAYYPQNHPEMGHLRHMVLLYGDRKETWSPDSLRYYVTHLDQQGQPDDWLFDSFLLTPAYAPSGNAFLADVNRGTSMSGEGDFYAIPCPNPATKRDCEDLLDLYFGPGGWLESLETTIRDAHAALKAPDHRHNVVLLVPYPGIAQAMWGKLEGRTLNFSTTGQSVDRATRDRLTAVRWFVDEALARFADGSAWPHLNLLGFYWPFESVYRGWEVDDHWLLKEFRKHLKAVGKKLTWIPFSATYNTHLLDNYQEYYFDLAFQQPNHMFYVNTPGIEGPAKIARERNAGFEMEYYVSLGEPIAVEPERHQRFRDYLNGGVQFGFMKEAACAWFHGADGIRQMYGHEDPQERAFYEDIYAFIKGTYTVK